MSSMSKIIKGHDKKSHRKKVTKQQSAIEGNCQVSEVVYKCDIRSLLKKSAFWTSSEARGVPFV